MAADNLDQDRQAVMDQLTDEERAALAEDGMSEEEKAALQDIAGEDDDDDDDDDDDKGAGSSDGKGADGGKAGDDGKAAAADDGAADGAAAAAGTQVAEEEEPEFRARYHVEVPENLNEQLTAIDTELDGLAEKFEAGEISSKDLLSQQRELNAKRDGLMEIKRKAEMFAEINAQSAMQEWEFNVARFCRQVKKNEGIDYSDKKLSADFDTFVKVLANDPENRDKDYDFFLEQAHDRVKALHNIGKKPADPPPADPPPADPKKAAEEAAAARKPKVDAAPKTLAQVPGSDGPAGDTSGNEFESLDNLEGLDFEIALKKLTPEQRERYLAQS